MFTIPEVFSRVLLHRNIRRPPQISKVRQHRQVRDGQSCQDASVLGGSVGEMHARKIASIYDLAIRTGAPVVGLVESAGLRLQEGMDALNAFGTIYARQVKASGLIPQITAIFGNCGGGLALIPALTDFAFMAKDAKLFVNAPNTLAGNKEDKNDTAAASVKAA